MQQILLKSLVSNSKLDKKGTVGKPRARSVKREGQKALSEWYMSTGKEPIA